MQLSEKNTTSDCISRQAAIDALDGNVIVTSRESAQAVMDYIRGCADRMRSLPSAQPDLDEWCPDCKEYDKERNSCPRWNRVIRETLKDMKEAQPEIIRCKECKHWKKTCGDESWSVGDCDFFDEKLVMCKGFCAWAERGTDE